MSVGKACKYLLLISFLCTAPVVAQAQTSVAIVDIQWILAESKAAKSIHKQVKKHRDTFLEELSKQEQGLREQEKKLIEERKTLSKEELAKKQKNFEKKFLETRKLAQEKKRTLDKALGNSMSKLRDYLYTVVGEIAEEKGYDLVISSQQVVLGAKSLNIY